MFTGTSEVFLRDLTAAARLVGVVGSIGRPTLPLACTFWEPAQPLLHYVKKGRSPIPPAILSVEGLVQCSPLEIIGSHALASVDFADRIVAM